MQMTTLRRLDPGVVAGLLFVTIASSKITGWLGGGAESVGEATSALVAATCVEFALGVWLVLAVERRRPAAAACGFLVASVVYLLSTAGGRDGRPCECFGPLQSWLGDRGATGLRGVVWSLVGASLWRSMGTAPDRAPAASVSTSYPLP